MKPCIVSDSPVVIMLDLDTSSRCSSPSLAFICNFLLFLFDFFYLVVVLFFLLSLSAYLKMLIEVSPT